MSLREREETRAREAGQDLASDHGRGSDASKPLRVCAVRRPRDPELGMSRVTEA
jgi:hypothetical protein